MSTAAQRVLVGIFLVLGGLIPATAWSRIVINEVLYHPSNVAVQPGEEAERLQFIELHNSGAAPVDLAGAAFDDGIVFTFPTGAQLAPGAYLVVAEDPVFLALRGPAIPQGVAVYRWAAGILANGGETLRLVDAQGGLLDTLTYDDAGLWPGAADGTGPSLELANPDYNNAEPLVWRASAAVNGTPGAANGTYTAAPIVLSTTPTRGVVLPTFAEISITFAAPVRGVAAADLRVDGSPAAALVCASCVNDEGAGPWVFSGFAPPQGDPSVVRLRVGQIENLEGVPFEGDTWRVPRSVPRIVINEVHFNPRSAGDAEEFIELLNADAGPVNVSGWRLMEFGSPGCTLPVGTIVAPGEFVVCARDPQALEAATGYSEGISWGARDRLSNGGEPIALVDGNGTVVDRLVYSDAPPWPTGPAGPDGNGPSLELTNPAVDNSQGGAWRASAAVDGSPGAENSVFIAAPVVAAELPIRGDLIGALDEITVSFSEPVVGLSADLLTIGAPGELASPALAVRGEGAGPYVFTLDDPALEVTQITLAAGGVQSLSGTPFAGDSWRYFSQAPKIVINEIHYNPDSAAVAPGEDAETLQFIELYNAGAVAVDLSGFAMTNGIEYVLPAGLQIAADGYLVLAADAAALRAATGLAGDAPVVDWTAGNLTNGGETVELTDAYGHVVDVVPYDDGGAWTDEPDGRGPSLELIHPGLANDGGGAWKASVGPNGTPAARNSTYVADPPPVIFGTRHLPPIPRALQLVTISAVIVDDGELPPTATLYFREDLDPPVPYDSAPMFDDGQHGDGAAGDGRYGAVVPGLANQRQLDFYVEASDGSRTAVGPAGHNTPDRYGKPSQTYLCKFSDEVLPADAPVYHILVTAHNKRRQEALRGYPTRKQPFDATFVDGAGNVWYNVTERYRGQGSLSRFPSSYRVNFPRNRKLRSSLGFPIEALQLTAIRPAAQWITYELFNRAGLPAPHAGWAHVRYPGINYDTCCVGQNGYWGLHVVAERLDNDFLDSQDGAVQQRSTSSEGNLYRGRNDADLRWEGPDPTTYFVNQNGQRGYEKYNNESEDFWGDLLALCDAMSNTPAEMYVEHVRAHVDVDNWARYFALHMLMGNREGGFYRDTGDDYFIYFPPADEPGAPEHPDYSTPQYPGDRVSGRSQLVTWDADSTMEGANETIWRTNVAAPKRFLRHNAFAPIFVQAIQDMGSNEYSVETMNAVIDSMPDAAFSPGGAGNNVNPATKAQFKAWIANRHAFIQAELHHALTLDGGPRIEYAGQDRSFRLQGELQQAGTHNITVNGAQAQFSVFEGGWSFELPLVVGHNPALVQAWDRAGALKAEIDGSVFYNPVGPEEIHLELRAPRRMLRDKTLTLDAAITDPIGRVYYQAWDELGTVTAVRLPERTPVALTTTVFDPHVEVFNGTIRFQNGWGSVSLTLDEGAQFAPGDIELTTSWRGLSARRVVTVLGEPGYRVLSGALVGADLVWGPDETIRIAAAATVPAGSTLTIHPGTLIQVDTTGGLQNGTLINVAGNIQALGTRARPIHFFSARGPAAMTLTQSGSASNGAAWRGFHFSGAGSSTFRHVYLTGAGNGSVISHPRPPIFTVLNTHSLFIDRSVLVDSGGMMFSGQGTGSYVIRKSLVSRVGIGGEFFGNGHTLRVIDSWFTAVGHAPERLNLDGDLLHINGARSDQLIRGCVIQDGGDDGVDHTTSSFRIEHSIIWGIRDKAVSMRGGHAEIHNTLVFGARTGLRGLAATEYTTIATPNPITTVDAARMTIVWPASINTCQGTVEYTDVGNPEQLGCGEGNISVDPQYADPAEHDYTPRPGSPALTAGPTGGRIGWLGFPYGAVCGDAGDCDDTNACTGDTCVAGLCAFTAILGCSPCDIEADCDDGDPCTVDLCAEDGACGHQPAADGTACDDGMGCTAPDACTAGRCAGPVNCVGGQGCDGVGECIPPVARCENDAACDDGLVCNGAETCDLASGECVAGVVDCDDGVACTIDTCDDTAGGCVFTPSNVRCDDGNVCTDDVCDLVAGCGYVDNVAACDDGEPCTDGDVCAGGACTGGAPPVCDDGLDCTADRCEPGQGCAFADRCDAGEICAVARGVCEPEPSRQLIRDGVDGYAGTQDTYVWAGEPDTAFGAAEVLVADGALPPEEARQVLVRFDDLFGWGPGQIPPGARIDSATLRLFITDPSDEGAALHRRLQPWDVDATWNSLGDGVQIDDVEALDSPEATGFVIGTDVPFELDVTDSVNAWSAGAENFGWVLVMAFGATDDWQFASAESANAARRPSLSVVYLACERGFVGDGVRCEDIDECAALPAPCAVDAACTNTAGSFECACDEGFVGDGFECVDIDECAAEPAPCDASALCVNAPGSFECTCEPGYAYVGGRCTDVDECEVVSCGDDATCFNQPGSYACRCDPGFVGDGLNCEDTDECAAEIAPCDANATCTNLPGTFECACNANFVGDGVRCDDVNECRDNPCLDGTICVNLPGSFQCICAPGFTGDGVDCGECPGGAANPCGRRGQCEGPADAPVCVCDPGLGGTACETCAPGRGGYPSCWACPAECDDGNPCTTDDCDRQGRCLHVDNTLECDDGDACTVEDRCEAGVCGGAPACDDGDPCTDDLCDDGACAYDETVGACDDQNACTAGEQCVEGACVGEAVDCRDDNPCTVGSCDPETGCAQTWTPGCCVEDDDCGLGEGCVLLNLCKVVSCKACDTDSDCGAGGNRCVDYVSGSYCAVPCAGEGAPCSDGEVCTAADDESWLCQPVAGDCECVSEARSACQGGDLLWFTSCGEPEGIAADCEGRGCVEGACCVEGRRRVDGLCVLDDDGGRDGGAGRDAEVGDAGSVVDAGGAVDAGRAAVDAGVVMDAGGPVDLGDAEPAGGPDGGLPPITGGSDCQCDSPGSGGSAPVLLLIGLVGVLRRRQGRWRR